MGIRIPEGRNYRSRTPTMIGRNLLNWGQWRLGEADEEDNKVAIED